MKLLIAFAVSFVIAAALSACGSKPASTAVPRPTVTVIPTYSYQVPTESSVFARLSATGEATAQAASTQAAVTLDPELVTRGQGRYAALACGSCHGDNGEGTTKAKALAGTTLSEDDFIKFLRTGGTVGNAHLFASGKLSDTGAHNLYLYVLSLTQATPAP